MIELNADFFRDELMDTAEGSLVRPAEGSLVQVLPDEVSKFKHIMSQYKECVQQYDLRVVINTSKMIEMQLPQDTHFSKYELSKPDGAVFRECTAYIHGKSEDAILLSSSEGSEEKEPGTYPVM